MASPRPAAAPILAAIDVGTNAVRLELARVLSDGSLETLYQERNPVRPGEGMFKTGDMPPEVADRLISALRRFAVMCRRYRATVRAVATSAVREARNREEIVRRARKEAGIDLEVISGKEEARLICLGVLHGRPAASRSLVIDVGGGSTEIASAVGDRPIHLWSVALGAVRLTELFDATGKVGSRRLALMREYAAEILERGVRRDAVPQFKTAFGSSGTINAVVEYAADEDCWPKLKIKRLSRAVEALAEMTLKQRAQHFDPRRAEIIVGGAVVLEQAMLHLGLESIDAVDGGLRNGLLIELVRNTRVAEDNDAIAAGAEAFAQRFLEDADHSRQVARIAVSLFDDLTGLHKLPAASRPLLQAAALLHDVGHAVSYQRHHKHSYYLIKHADLPGLADRDRELVALIARYHRRSPPERAHPDMAGLSETSFRLVRKLSTLLRLADALDRGHHQAVRKVSAKDRDGTVQLSLAARAPVELELWDAERQSAQFRRVFSRKLKLGVDRR